MLITFVTLSQVDNLEGIFAELTSTGWVIPLWLRDLRVSVLARRSVC